MNVIAHHWWPRRLQQYKCPAAALYMSSFVVLDVTVKVIITDFYTCKVMVERASLQLSNLTKGTKSQIQHATDAVKNELLSCRRIIVVMRYSSLRHQDNL